MIDVQKTDRFIRWLTRLGDREARFRIAARISRLEEGNPGDIRPVGDGVQEMRIDCGPGYRLYFIWQGRTIVILLSGGDKQGQSRDIAEAKQLARLWRQRS